MAILGYLWQFGDKKRANPFGFALFGRGIRTLPICKIVDFEWVPNNLVTRFARNNDSSNPQHTESEARNLFSKPPI